MNLSFYTSRALRPPALNKPAEGSARVPLAFPVDRDSTGDDTACGARAHLPEQPVARALRRDRLDFEGALSERERFEGYENAAPWSPDGVLYDHDEAPNEADRLKGAG